MDKSSIDKPIKTKLQAYVDKDTIEGIVKKYIENEFSMKCVRFRFNTKRVSRGYGMGEYEEIEFTGCEADLE